MLAEDDELEVNPTQGDETEEYSFDELAKGLASGALSRTQALKLAAAAILGGALGIFGFAAPAQARRRRRCYRCSLTQTEDYPEGTCCLVRSGELNGCLVPETFCRSGTLPSGTECFCGPPSDRNLKERFAAVDEREILARLVEIPVESWNYKGQDPSIRHIGPMAQDFAAAFGVGEDDKRINMVDANGVTMAAIQALYRMVREKDAKIDALRAEVAKLNQRNDGSPPAADICPPSSAN